MSITPQSHFSRFEQSPKYTFTKRVYAVVRDIKAGETLTYGEVAYKAGYPGAARAVGTVMRHTTDMSVPCHRVVAASGREGSDRGAKRRAATRKAESV